MEITKLDNIPFYKVSFNYDEKIVKAIGKFSGAWYDEDRKYWVVPDYHTKKLQSFYKKYYLLSIARAPMVIGELPELPDLKTELPLNIKPFPYQGKGIEFLHQAERAMPADDMGLGKTLQAIGATIYNDIVNADAFPVIVICPNVAKVNWQREWLKVAGINSMILSPKYKNNWHLYYKEGLVNVFIVNYESLKTFFVESMPDGDEFTTKDISFNSHRHLFKSFILDESHRAKEKTTQQAKMCLGISRGKRYRYALTGTPVVNKTEDLIPQLHILGRMDDFGGEEYFRLRYCETDDYLPELNYLLRKICFYQRMKREVAKELPGKFWQVVSCEISTREEYNDAERDLANYLKEYRNKTDAEVMKSMRGELMVAITVCRNISARGKIHAAVDIINNVLSQKEKIVVFVFQIEVAEAILKHYKSFVSVTGSDTGDARQRNIDLFQDGSFEECPGIVCSMKAASEAITLTASSTCLFIEQPWTAATEDQCTDRLDRISQTCKVRCIKLLGNTAVDEMMNNIIESKRSLAGTITGNRASFEKEVIDKLSDALLNQQKETA